MQLSRRDLIKTSLALAGAGAWPAYAGPDWPRKPVKLVVPTAAGGGVDVATRMLADQLRDIWGGTPAVVENKTGGNTVIAVNSVLNAPGDGYNFLVTIGVTMQLPDLGQKINFDPVTDLMPVGAITVEQLVVVVNAKSGIRTFEDLVAEANKRGKGMTFGTFGIGSSAHVLALQLGKVLKSEVLPVHYRGAALAVQGVLSGEVDMALSNIGTVQQHIDAGTLRAIAATGEDRYRFVRDVPTLKELGIPGFEFLSWIGVFAPKGTDLQVIDKLEADMRRALAEPALVAKINGFYQEPGNFTPAQFQQVVQREKTLLGSLIREFGIRLE
jgi:tripartite-type tricarboxylate transporter receptor subunit TctC